MQIPTGLADHVRLHSHPRAEGFDATRGLGDFADDVVALIAAIKEEVESAPIDFSAIEVEKKGKKEDAESAE